MRSTNLMLMAILTWSLNEATTIYKEVLVNATTSISCIPDEDIQIQWQHIPPGGSKDKPNYVYAGRRFYVSSDRNFRLETDSITGPYHLIIPNAKYEDAGLYDCKEDNSSRAFDSTQLTVLESNPKCESDMKPNGYVGPSTCNLQQENMIFTCAVKFNGIPPQMIWKNLNGSQSFNESESKNETGQITSSLIIRSDSVYDGTIFNCQSTKSDAKCSTEIIKIQYFESLGSVVEKKVGDRVNCTVKSNQLLDFKWTVLQDGQRVFLTNNQTLLIESLGLYQCVVEYHIGNEECSAIAWEVNLYSPDTVTCKPTTPTIAAISVLSILVVICIASIIALVWKVRQLCKKMRKNATNEIGEPLTSK